MFKLLTITWSGEDTSSYKEEMLYNTFIKNNEEKYILNLHFNRNNFTEKEAEFKDKYGYQYEYLLYRIVKFKEYMLSLEDGVYICADTNDVVCLDNINNINFSELETNVIFACENHQMPSASNITNWPVYQYKDPFYLNGGLYIGKKQNILKMLEDCINKVLIYNYHNFGGDQGVYTFDYLNNKNSKIILDKENKWFLCTYNRSANDYIKKENKLFSCNTNTTPIFIHDNGWNYGSPKFINTFSLR
jgi:hypothetical protein